MTPAEFRQTDTYKIVERMKATGNRPGIIAIWKDGLATWANAPAQQRNVDAAAVRAWLPHWQVRPFYTAAELAPLWPMIALAIGVRDRLPNVVRSVGRLEQELKWSGLPFHDIRGQRYYATECLHHWREHSALDWQIQMEINHA